MSDDATTTTDALTVLRERRAELNQEIFHLQARVSEVAEMIRLLETPKRKPRQRSTRETTEPTLEPGAGTLPLDIVRGPMPEETTP